MRQMVTLSLLQQQSASDRLKGVTFTNSIERPGGEIRYLDFLLPGICAMTILFGASQSGIELIRDMQTHFLGRLLNAPADRRLLLIGKLTADVSRLLAQATLVFLLGLVVGARISSSLPAPGVGSGRARSFRPRLLRAFLRHRSSDTCAGEHGGVRPPG